ncbi:MAG: hypothetical protein OFPI_41110 [Osedax symbiont Rs2]|nr:MAG: hypothetical protein OFPI_41110 [Osedax symbiont Rs2]
MRMQIKTLQRNLAVTTLYVTHDQVEAMTMADRLVVLKDGIAAQIGTPMEIYDDPHNQFVAGFIGSPAMNFIDCTVSDDEIDIGGQKMLRPANVCQRGALVLGIRPEHFDNDADTTAIEGQVEMIEKIGASVFLYVKCDNIKELIVIQREGHSQVQIGEIVNIDPNPKKLYFFDKNTQQRIY